MKFGEFVVKQGYCSEEKLKKTLEIAKFRKLKLGRLMLELGFIKPSELDSLLIRYLKPNSSRSFQELSELKSKVPLEFQNEAVFKKLEAIPIKVEDSSLTVITRVFSDSAVRKLENFFDLTIEMLQVRDSLFELLQSGESESSEKHSISVTHELSADERLMKKDPYVELAHHCLKEAAKDRASDIHFEPFGDHYLIRFRIHGTLTDWKKLPSDHIEPLTNKLKWVLGLDLAVVSKPQDGRASFETLGFDARVNSMPVSGNREKIVIRLQFQEQTPKLEEMGFESAAVGVLRSNIQKTEGLIVISGPTGSGKTTTLYALLEEMDRLGKNISTLENPVEKHLERINQSNVEGKEDFYEFQRALMRQDPDIILLGEIRDPETADLAMKLASTGHLVLSTVHANGAREVLDRLFNLGVDEHTIKSNLRLSVAQRLVKLICQNCSRRLKEEVRQINKEGCDHCTNGVIGRKPIIEYLEGGDVKVEMKTTLREEIRSLAIRGLIDGHEFSNS